LSIWKAERLSGYRYGYQARFREWRNAGKSQHFHGILNASQRHER
jgi:frataxin-like iron-binding protein CyaY